MRGRWLRLGNRLMRPNVVLFSVGHRRANRLLQGQEPGLADHVRAFALALLCAGGIVPQAAVADALLGALLLVFIVRLARPGSSCLPG